MILSQEVPNETIYTMVHAVLSECRTPEPVPLHARCANAGDMKLLEMVWPKLDVARFSGALCARSGIDLTDGLSHSQYASPMALPQPCTAAMNIVVRAHPGRWQRHHAAVCDIFCS